MKYSLLSYGYCKGSSCCELFLLCDLLVCTLLCLAGSVYCVSFFCVFSFWEGVFRYHLCVCVCLAPLQHTYLYVNKLLCLIYLVFVGLPPCIRVFLQAFALVLHLHLYIFYAAKKKKKYTLLLPSFL